ncbi:hypothetical protein [Evansella clarkii]|nr:hypothetical protein [Evansella clarkii]
MTHKTDDNGKVTFEGFLGDYELICGDKKESFRLDNDAETVRLVI